MTRGLITNSARLVSWFKYQPLATLGLAAGVIYNSWPLGYLLNPQTTKNGLASALEAVNQPYNWLFVSGDVLCSLLTLIIAWGLLKDKLGNKSAIWALGSLAAFGVMTALSALLPLSCQTDVSSCGYGLGQSFGLHDLSGAIASLGLFIAMISSLDRLKARRTLHRLGVGLLLYWSAWGLWYLFLSFLSAGEHPLAQRVLIASQQLFLILSGLIIWLVAYAWEGTL
jgi:hypothetical protein